MKQTMNYLEQGRFFLIAGPCVIESAELCFEVAERLVTLTDKYNLPLVFKSSYKKANRLSKGSFSGPGIDEGLKILEQVKKKFDLPILTDVHETGECGPVAEVADILQIPAFLCRQTDLLLAATETGRWVNIKKGQFLAPEDMEKIAAKAESKKLILTERGTTFGYGNLIVDFTALIIMARFGYPVVFDVTHALQLPGGGGNVSSGRPQFVIPMAKAATAIGINGLFVETHPDPTKALSDAQAMIPLDRMDQLLHEITAVRNALSEEGENA